MQTVHVYMSSARINGYTQKGLAIGSLGCVRVVHKLFITSSYGQSTSWHAKYIHVQFGTRGDQLASVLTAKALYMNMYEACLQACSLKVKKHSTFHTDSELTRVSSFSFFPEQLTNSRSNLSLSTINSNRCGPRIDAMLNAKMNA